MTNVLGTFWSDWFIYFREGRVAAAAGGWQEGKRRRRKDGEP